MTLQLVPNVTELQVANVQNIPECLRLLADDIEAGTWGGIQTVHCLMLDQVGVGSVTYGENGSVYELIGILESAKANVLADLLSSDD